MKYPIGIQDFASIIKDGYVYVDKTALVHRLATEGKIYFLSRPRRFGKSLLVSTLKYYFQGRKDLFAGLAIDALEKEWAEYPVFHLDFNGTDFTIPGRLELVIEKFLSDQEDIYGRNPNSRDTGSRFKDILKASHEKTGRRAVVLIDEYDKPLLDVLDSGLKTTQGINEFLLEEHHRNILKGFYSVFKAADENLQFVLLTGVTKFSQISVFSGFNQPSDISMDTQYEALCGITEEELYHYFEEPIGTLAKKYKCTPDEMKLRLKKQYDGYHFSKNCEDIYNPFSLFNALDAKEYKNFWFSTGTPTFLIELLQEADFNVRDLEGLEATDEEFDAPTEQIQSPVPVLYQSGYLTIKGFDPDFQTYKLAYPNKEVRKGFIESLLPTYVHRARENNTFYVISFIRDLRKGDIESCLERTRSFFASIPHDLENKTEKHYQTIFYLLFRLMGQYVDVEVKSAIGRADVVLKLSDAIYVFEFKFDGTPDEALAQIESKNYAIPYQSDGRRIVKIGVNFDSATRTIGEWKIVD